MGDGVCGFLGQGGECFLVEGEGGRKRKLCGDELRWDEIEGVWMAGFVVLGVCGLGRGLVKRVVERDMWERELGGVV